MTTELINPSHNPLFGSTIDEEVWYLAHPLAPDDRYSYEDNMKHVIHLVRVFYDCGVRVIAPWHTLCLSLDDTNNEHRRIGLEVDCYVAKKLGKIILTGHKLSSGMMNELRSVLDNNGGVGTILNFIGWKSSQIKMFYEKLREVQAEYGV